jgi:short-chain fatty acids transporter
VLSRLTDVAVHWVRRFMPDPFLYAIGLTALTFLLAWAVGLREPSSTPIALALGEAWYRGLFQILEFAMQMALILVAGHALGAAAPVRRLLLAIASLPRTPGQAAALIVAVTMLASLLNWGFGLVVGGLLARAVAGRVRGLDFGLAVAAAYSGFVVWASGLSSSIALVSATPGSAMNFIEKATHQVVPLSETLLAPCNWVPVVVLLLVLPLLFSRLRPADIRELSAAPPPPEALPVVDDTPAAKLERSRFFALVPMALGVLAAIALQAHGALRPDLNTTILAFVVLGLALHGRPLPYLAAWNDAARSVGPLLLQYPLYGGILGLLSTSRLAELLAGAAAAHSTARTFPLLTFLSSNVLSLFVPSGGGHWAVQGPIMLPAAAALHVSPAVTAMAVALGEQTANMVQPFWALPLLAIAGLGARDVMGYCLLTFAVSLTAFGLALLLLT